MSTSDAQPSRLLPRRPHVMVPPSSIPPAAVSEMPDARKPVPNPAHTAVTPPRSTLPMKPLTPTPDVAQPEHASYEHAIDFATHSWDLKTGGLKTLTAKREFPTRLDRRSAEVSQDLRESSTRSYMFAMIVLVCVISMLIGGGVILFVILQP